MFAPCAKWYSWFTCHVNGTRHSYELRRSDGGPKYEIWLWVMKSYIELHLRLLESYQVRRLLDIHNNFRVMRNKCEHQRRHQDWFVTKIVSDKFNGLTTICSNAWVKGIFTTIDPRLLSIPWLPQILHLKKCCNWYNKKVLENISILVSRKLNSRFDGWSKDFGLIQNIEETYICMKLSGSLIVSWNLICRRHILSGSYVSIILALYVTDIFE